MRDARDDDSRPEDDQKAIDRAFAELIADFHRPATSSTSGTADHHPDASDPQQNGPDVRSSGADQPAESEPLPEAKPVRPPFEFRIDLDAPIPPDPEEPEERYVPPPAPPLPRPTPPVFVGWLGICYAILVMFLLAFDVPLPDWMGWIAIAAFLGGLALLLSRLPRHRPPDDDDGARL